MGKNLQIFNNEEFGEIRVIEHEGEPWLVGKDVAEKLGYQNGSRDINRHVDEEDRNLISIHDGVQERVMIIINESGLYSLILGSKLPNARIFKNWVTREVLPQIRKHGMYAKDELLDNPDLLLDVVKKYKEEREEKLLLQNQIEKDKPKVLFAEAVESSDDVILVKEMATILTQRGFDIGQNQLFQYLRDNEYLCKKAGDMYHLPTRKYEHLFKVTKRIVQNSKGSVVKNTPKITGKGQLYFIKKFDEYLERGLTIKDLLERKSA